MRILLSRRGGLRIEVDPLEPALARPVRLAMAPFAVRSDDVFCCHKTTNRTVYDRLTRQHPEADDVILGNEHGEITETCRANLLFRLHGKWFTPPLSSGGLAGIARQRLIDRGEVRELVLLTDQLGEVEDLAVVSSLRGRRPATLEMR